MTVTDDIVAAGQRDKQIADLCRFVHRHNGKAVHDRFNGLDGVDFGDNNNRTHTLCAHCHTLTAPAVAADDNGLACDDQVRCVHNAVERGLTRAVAVVKEVLAVRVVDVDHRVVELACLFAGEQTVNTRRGFLGTADQILAVFAAFAVEQMRQVAAVVDHDIGAEGKGLLQMLLIFFVGDTAPCVDLKARIDKCRRNVILRGQRIASGNVNLCTAGSQRQRKVRRLCFQMNRHRNLLSGKRLFLGESLVDGVQNRHIALDPVDLVPAALGKGNVLDCTHMYVVPFRMVILFLSFILYQRCGGIARGRAQNPGGRVNKKTRRLLVHLTNLKSDSRRN